MRRLLCSLSLLALLAPAHARADSEEEESTPLSAAPIEEKKGPALNEVEHGFYIGAEGGAQFVLGVPKVAYSDGSGDSSGGAKLATGQAGGVELGYEPMPLLSLGALVWGANANTPSRYTGVCDPTAGSACPRGNYSTLLIGANARLNLSLGPDAYQARRLFFYVRAGAGYALVRPSGLLASQLVVFGGPGIEYFTHLRHFSVGLEADATFGLGNKDFAALVQPVVRYSF